LRIIVQTNDVPTATEKDDWRRKYYDSLRSMEREEQQFRALEQVLRKLVSRVCLAAQGQSKRLDAELNQLSGAVRGGADATTLEPLGAAITDAVHALDQSTTIKSIMQAPAETAAAPNATATAAATPTPTASTVPTATEVVVAPTPVAAPPGEAILGDERVRAVLEGLLSELRRDPLLINDADAIDALLSVSLTREQLPEVLARVVELVGRRIQKIESAKRDIEALLALMMSRLDDLTSYVAGQDQEQHQQMASSAELNTQLTGEMRALGESVDSDVDLQQIRLKLRTRLDSIGQHLHSYREREAERSRASRDRNDKMRSRVVELEGEARRLQTQLQDEQRLSLIDVLTQIPNRLAYEQRIEAEMKRWQRFGQPTCVAAWDIDSFKNVNDTYGHRAGDKVLKFVAECLAARLRSTDFVARFGGEEFVMILPGTGLEDAQRLVEQMRVAVSELGFHFRSTPVSVTISCGLTVFRKDDTADDAFERADKAMYRAKDAGRNRCVAV
jgi:diguanylate cyclase